MTVLEATSFGGIFRPRGFKCPLKLLPGWRPLAEMHFPTNPRFVVLRHAGQSVLYPRNPKTGSPRQQSAKSH